MLGRTRNVQMPSKVQFLLLLLAGVIEACCCYLVSLGDLQRQIPQMWAGAFPAFLCYALAAYLVLRRDVPPERPHLILGAALVFRLTLWWSPATLSDDIFRYVWDGRVQLAGINPYLYAPSAPEVAHLRDVLYHSINHAAIPTIYPPLAQLFFRAICVLSATPAAFKLVLLLCDWGLCLLLAHSLVRRGQDPRRVVLYAWNPLPLIEVAGSGHIDALGVLLLFAALYALHSQRWAAAVCGLAGAFLVKLVPLALLPTFWRRPLTDWFDFRQRSALLLFPTLGLLAFWPFAAAGEKLATGFADLRTTLALQRGGLLALSLCLTVVGRPRLRTRSLALHSLFRIGSPRRPNPLPRPLPSRLCNPRRLRLALADCASLVPALGPPVPRLFPQSRLDAPQRLDLPRLRGADRLWQRRRVARKAVGFVGAIRAFLLTPRHHGLLQTPHGTPRRLASRRAIPVPPRAREGQVH